MGQIIERLAHVKLSDGTELDFELNKPPSGRGEDVVHIQNLKFRTEFSRTDFMEYAAAFLAAADKLKRSKNI
jgi:hypothetical protein